MKAKRPKNRLVNALGDTMSHHGQLRVALRNLTEVDLPVFFDLSLIFDALRATERRYAGQPEPTHDTQCPVCSANVYGRVKHTLTLLDSARMELDDLKKLTQP